MYLTTAESQLQASTQMKNTIKYNQKQTGEKNRRIVLIKKLLP
jgi:hypothetical protein